MTLQNHEQNIVALAKALAEKFREADIGRVFCEITISGQSHSDVEISYRVDKQGYGDSNTKGYRLDAVLDEFFRRNGYNERYNQLLLTKVNED